MPREARLALRQHPGIAALVTDVHLAGTINGIAFAHEARRLCPSIRILVVSGIAQGFAEGGAISGKALHAIADRREPQRVNEAVGCMMSQAWMEEET